MKSLLCFIGIHDWRNMNGYCCRCDARDDFFFTLNFERGFEMANPYTGEIYPLADGEKPKPGDLLITEEVAEKLKRLQITDRLAALQKMREESGGGDY